MAAAALFSNQPSPFGKHLICSICFEVFTQPVTTVCGHTFCQFCLERNMLHTDKTCPLCKTFLLSTPQVNIVLKDVIQEMESMAVSDFTGAPGEVPCDICTDTKLKAKKSCLVCLASYCQSHLELHSSAERLKGHKLVDPVEDLDARACLTHGRPLELYSRRREACVCALCIDGDPDEIVSAEDEWTKKKAQLGQTKADLKRKIDKRTLKVEEISADLKSSEDAIDEDWWDIDAVFTAVFALVEEAQARVLQPLRDRRQQLKEQATDLINDLRAEVGNMETKIYQMDLVSPLEDHILFLQRYPAPENPGDFRDWENVKLDTLVLFGTMRKILIKMVENIQRELEKLTAIELTRVSKFTGDVKLNPMTAHPRLVVSDDGKEVRDGGVKQQRPDNPERFDKLGCVLGLESVSSGRAYWEVRVGNKTAWELGVARGGGEREGNLRECPGTDYWVVSHFEGEKYIALDVPPVRLYLDEKPETVGVFVDYEEGLVSLYNVTARSHIYSFTECSFSDDLFPYFSPRAKQDGINSEPLVISRG